LNTSITNHLPLARAIIEPLSVSGTEHCFA
jgi:hypothetical protein